MLEVYIDNMIINYSQEESHDQNLWRLFKRVQQYNMSLNIKEWTFWVRADKLLGLYLIEREISSNPNKCEVII